MSSPEVNPFSIANSCSDHSSCGVGKYGTSGDNDETRNCPACATGKCSAAGSTSCSTCSKMPDGCKGVTSSSDRTCYPRKAVDELNADGSGTHPTYGPMKDWDMSLVTDISYLFYQKGTMNADLSSWDVSSVTTMYRGT